MLMGGCGVCVGVHILQPDSTLKEYTAVTPQIKFTLCHNMAGNANQRNRVLFSWKQKAEFE